MGMCGKCIHKDRVGTEYPCGICDGVTFYEEPKPITNADRIRAMSDEKLSEFISNSDMWAFLCENNIDKVIDWLKQEVE